MELLRSLSLILLLVSFKVGGVECLRGAKSSAKGKRGTTTASRKWTRNGSLLCVYHVDENDNNDNNDDNNDVCQVGNEEFVLEPNCPRPSTVVIVMGDPVMVLLTRVAITKSISVNDSKKNDVRGVVECNELSSLIVLSPPTTTTQAKYELIDAKNHENNDADAKKETADNAAPPKGPVISRKAVVDRRGKETTDDIVVNDNENTDDYGAAVDGMAVGGTLDQDDIFIRETTEVKCGASFLGHTALEACITEIQDGTQVVYFSPR